MSPIELLAGNPIRGPKFSPSPDQRSHPIVSIVRDGVGWCRRTGREWAMSRYRIASMAARFRSAWLGTLVAQSAGCPGTFSQSEIRRQCLLCVSFECDSLNEELEEGRGCSWGFYFLSGCVAVM
ncbi:uncharacterized protein N7529_000789 [Penicillium soppii]|uniref:uncharacterized protein n=1 Tax=Penicillium soppii TaxID=69789 RepID=UPI002549AF69|nr:uncharacterized protein N7529_000789 [Penicillium soppii]KAJ5882117.1 hypothetical protein N7529_000789 [Penicillium soppii]